MMSADETKILIDQGASRSEALEHTVLLNLPPSAGNRRELIKQLGIKTCPLVLAGILQTLDNFLRVRLVSTLGSKALAADALNISICGFVLATDSGFLNPISAMVSQAEGSGNRRVAGKIVQQGWIAALLLSIPTIGTLSFAEPILVGFGQDKELSAMVGPYARIIGFASPAIYGVAVDVAFLKSISKINSLIPLYTAWLGIGIGVSYLCIPGALGPKFEGILGSGIATFTQAWICWLGVKLYYLTNDFHEYGLYNFRSLDFTYLRQIFKYGSPMTALSMGEQLRNFLTVLMAGSFGAIPLAINQISGSYIEFFRSPAQALRQATQVYVSQSRGREDYRQIRHFGNLGISAEAALYTLPIIAYAAAPIPLAEYFISAEELKDLDTYIRIVFITKAIGKFLESIQGSASESLKGLLDTFYPSIFQLCCSLAVILPLSYLMSITFDLDVVGLNAAAGIGTLIEIPVLLKRWYRLSQGPDEVPTPSPVVAERLLIEPNSNETPANDARLISEPPSLLISYSARRKSVEAVHAQSSSQSEMAVSPTAASTHFRKLSGTPT